MSNLLLLGAGPGKVLPFAASLNLWLRADDYGLADGASISTNWVDRSGQGNSASPSGSPVFKTNVIGGRSAIDFNSAGRKFVTASFLSSAYNTALSVYGVVRRAGTGTKVWISNQSAVLYLGSDNPDVPLINTSGLSDTSLSGGVVNVGQEPAYIIGFRYDGATKRVAVLADAGNFDYIGSEAATGNLGLSGTFTVGDFSAGGFAWNDLVADVLVYNEALSTAKDASVVRHLRSYYGYAPTLIYFAGNSLTLGTGASDAAHAYPALTLALLGAGYAGKNIGIAGNTTAEQDTASPAAIDARLSTYRDKYIAVLWEVTNDLVINQSASGAITRYAAWCSARRTAGCKVVAVTVLPRTPGGIYVGFEADRQTVNTSIRANWQTYADALADVAADARIGAAGASNDTTYFNADKIHLNDAGYAIVAGVVRPAILTL